MNRTRTTPYAILGMLSIRPMSGYDIRKEAATSIDYFWSESYGQIYPALRELAEQGLARRRTERGEGGPDRHVYEITPLGRKALHAWLEEAPRVAPFRSELLLKLFFGDAESADVHRSWIERLRGEADERLRRFADLRKQLLREQRDHPSLAYWLVTLSYGEHHAEAQKHWCEETLGTLGTRRARAVSRRAASAPTRHHAGRAGLARRNGRRTR